MSVNIVSILLAAIRDAYQETKTQFQYAFVRGTIESNPVERAIFGFCVLVVLVVSLFPFYIMVMTSFVSDSALYALPPTIVPSPGDLTLSQYEAVLGPGTFPFIRYFVNSLLVAAVTASLGVAVATFGGYSIARLEFPGRPVLTRLVLVVYMFSGILLVVPLFQIMVWLGLVDTLVSLMITYMVQILPLSLYMLGNYFRSVPEEIEEAALLDGYSRIETIVYVTLPLSAPAIVAVFLYAFMIAWNEYLFASIFLQTDSLFTLPIGIEALTLTFDRVWGQIMAASLMTSVPVIVMFLYLERYMIEGLTTGGVEG